MAFNQLYRFSIQDISGNYFYATLRDDATWIVNRSTTIRYIEVLPDGWAETAIEWQRDMSYMGIFRSQTNAPYKFSMDGAAIIDHIRSLQGLQGYGLLTIEIAKGFEYIPYYQSELDFKTYRRIYLAEQTEIGLLDSRAVRDLHAFGDTKYNIPIWKLDSFGLTWILNDSEWIYHTGIKLMYNGTYTTSASPTNNLVYNFNAGTGIAGYKMGQTGALLPNRGAHTIPFLSALNITQNDGATQFIGNNILQNHLKQGNQVSGVELVNEVRFEGANTSQPWTRNNNSLCNLLPTPTRTIQMYANVVGEIVGDIDVTLHGNFNANAFLGFVFWEMGPGVVIGSGESQPSVDTPVYEPVFGVDPGSGMKYTPIYKKMLTGLLTPGGAFDVTVPVTIRQDCCYMFGLIYDNDDGLSINRAIDNVAFSKLQYCFFSKFTNGSTAPVDAPMYPPSVAAGFRLNTLFNKLVANFPTRQSNQYGFPVPVVTDYTFSSAYLSDPLLPPVKDVVPYQIIMTSDYCIHNLSGQSMVTTSFNEQFDFCKKALGMGLSLVGNSFVMENLAYFFDQTIMILDLGYDVTGLEITQDIQGVGSALNLGYSKSNLRANNFGVDPVCSGLNFTTPATNVPTDLDYQETSITTEMYDIEMKRAQQTSQPIGSSIDPQSPTDSNTTICIYCEASSIILPKPVYDPANNPAFGLSAYQPVKFPTAQNIDPTAATAPYMQGWYYPDTAINVPLSPCRALYRDTGAMLHSVLDKMDADYLAFRNTYVMQYNNTTLGLPGFSSKLDVGTATAAVTEHEDKPISTLPDKLFLPIICKFKSTSAQTLFQQLNTNPNGYVRFFWKKPGFGYDEYHVFILNAVQQATQKGNIATEFRAWAAPSNPSIGYASPL